MFTVSIFFSAGLLLFGHIFRIFSFFQSGLLIMVFMVILTVLFRLKIIQVIKQWSLWAQNFLMGVYDVMGAQFLNKKELKIKKCTKNAQIWSVKYTKFDNFLKKCLLG